MMYCHHTLQNFQTRFKQTGLKNLFWEVGKAPNASEYEVAMRKIKEEDVPAWQFLSLLETRNWAFHAMDSRVKRDHITSNFVESFNAWVGEERFRPPITMLEHIRSKIMALIFTRQQIAARWEQPLTPDVYGRMRMLERKSRHTKVIRCHLYEFEVVLYDLRVGVQLDNRRCDCNAWELKGIPCVHALACIHFIRANIEEYVDPYFTSDKWRKTFDGVVHPIPSRIYWPSFPEATLLAPPIPKRQTGRPRLYRTKVLECYFML